MSDRNKEKRALFTQWMEGDHVLVHLDSRKPGVSVPSNFQENPSLTLKLSYLFQGETKHDDQEIRSFLRFQENYLECVLPWTAVWGMSSAEGQQKLWPEDLPPELLLKLAKEKFKELGQKIFARKTTADAETPSKPLKATTSETPEKNTAAARSAGSETDSSKPDRTKILKRIK